MNISSLTQVLWVRNLDVATGGGSGSGSLVKLQSRCLSEVRSSASLMGLECLLPKRLPDMAGKSVPSFLFFPPFAAENVDATTLDHESKRHGRAVSWKEPGLWEPRGAEHYASSVPRSPNLSM